MKKKEMRYKRRLKSVQMSSKLMEGALQTSLEDTNFDIIISRKVNMLYVP